MTFTSKRRKCGWNNVELMLPTDARVTKSPSLMMKIRKIISDFGVVSCAHALPLSPKKRIAFQETKKKNITY